MPAEHDRDVKARNRSRFRNACGGGWKVEIALAFSLALTVLGLWIASAANEFQEALRRRAFAEVAQVLDLDPDPVKIDFAMFWDEVDPGSLLISLPVSLEGTDGAVQARIEGGGGPEISVDEGDFSPGPITVSPGQKVRVRIKVPETLGESHRARLSLGERVTQIQVRSRRQGAFAFDYPDGRLVAVPARGEVLRIPVDLTTVEYPSLRIDPLPPEDSGLTFELEDDGIAVICAMPETCIGEHPVSMRISAVKRDEIAEAEGAETSAKDEVAKPEDAMTVEIAANYTIDITEDAPMGFLSDTNLGMVDAQKGILAQIEITTSGVQGAYVEIERALGKGDRLRLLRSEEDMVSLICDSAAECIGRHEIFARAESWNPHLVVRRRFEIEVVTPKEEKSAPKTSPES